MKHLTMSRVSGALTLAVSSTLAAGVVQPCQLIENGSFDDGLRGWTVTPVEQSEGQADASAAGSIFDGTTYQPFNGAMFDSSVLRLDALAQVSAGEPGSSVAEVTVSTSAVVTNTGLSVLIGGPWEFFFFGDMLYSLDAAVQVEGPGGEIASAGFHEGSAEPLPGCAFGLSIIGTFDMSPPTIHIDLAEAGIEIGELVEISISLRAEAATVDSCQNGDVSAFLLVDDVQFCPAPVFADLTGDGQVNAADLALLLGAWTMPGDKGACDGAPGGSCPPDLNEDGAVNAADLALLLGAWTSPRP